MSKRPEPPGCRSAAIAGGILVGLGLAFMAVGLALINDGGCEGICETLSLTLLYAGLPFSAVFSVLFGDSLVLAWPLDITLWVVVGFMLARFSDNRQRSVLGMVLLTVVIALVYGLVLSSLVELAI
ncbi:MAG TPA: hypothetical protein VF148_05645 [Acidimicrobiia bacterium]